MGRNSRRTRVRTSKSSPTARSGDLPPDSDGDGIGDLAEPAQPPRLPRTAGSHLRVAQPNPPQSQPDDGHDGIDFYGLDLQERRRRWPVGAPAAVRRRPHHRALRACPPGWARELEPEPRDETEAPALPPWWSEFPLLAPLSVVQTAAAMRHWRLQAEALLDPAEAADPSRSLHCSRIMDGRRELRGHLDAEGGEILETALCLAASDDVEAEPQRCPSQRRADALVDLCRWFLDHHGRAVPRRHRPHVNLVVDLEELERRTGGRVLGGPELDAPPSSGSSGTPACTGWSPRDARPSWTSAGPPAPSPLPCGQLW